MNNLINSGGRIGRVMVVLAKVLYVFAAILAVIGVILLFVGSGDHNALSIGIYLLIGSFVFFLAPIGMHIAGIALQLLAHLTYNTSFLKEKSEAK